MKCLVVDAAYEKKPFLASLSKASGWPALKAKLRELRQLSGASLGGRRNARVVDDDFLDEGTGVLAVAVLADDHSEGATAFPFDIHQKGNFAILKLVNAFMHSRLAKSDFVSIMLLFSHIFA